MEQDREVWEELHRRFDPSKPAGADQRVPRPRGPAEQILAKLERPWGEQRFLLFGTQGTGKTTELIYLQSQVRNQHRVIAVDVERFFEARLGDAPALQYAKPWEVLMLCGLAIYQAGIDQLGVDWGGLEGELSRAIRDLAREGDESPAIDLGSLAAGVVGLAAASALALGAPVAAAGTAAAVSGVVGALRMPFKIGQVDTPGVPDQDERSKALLRAVNALLVRLGQESDPVMLIVDGLDRIQVPETNDQIFIQSALLRSLRCQLVVACSLELAAGRIQQVPGFQLLPLPNVPVLLHEDPSRHGPGIDVCLELWERRTKDIDAQHRISEEALRHLAYYSGGRFREFNRLIQNMCGPGWDVGSDCLGMAQADKILDERRRQVEIGIHAGHIEVLRAVMKDPDNRLDDPRVGECILNKWLFPYPNMAPWWYPNPLLLLHKLKVQP